MTTATVTKAREFQKKSVTALRDEAKGTGIPKIRQMDKDTLAHNLEYIQYNQFQELPKVRVESRRGFIFQAFTSPEGTCPETLVEEVKSNFGVPQAVAADEVSEYRNELGRLYGMLLVPTDEGRVRAVPRG